MIQWNYYRVRQSGGGGGGGGERGKVGILQLILDISKTILISNYLYLKVKFLVTENLL